MVKGEGAAIKLGSVEGEAYLVQGSVEKNPFFVREIL